MNTKIIAHRGASKLAPENTMPAFKLAYRLDAEGIETDVHLTKDNIPVLIHDELVNRTTNGTGYIKDYTYDQLKQLDAGSWFNSKFAGTTILTLEEFLQWAQDKSLYLNIELKNNKIDYENLESIVYDMVNYYQIAKQTTLSTFNPTSVRRMEFFRNTMGVALLVSKKKHNLVSYAKELGASAIHIKYRLLSPQLVEQCHREDMIIRVYTVNRLTHIMQSFTSGCDSIFTDVPHKALQYRELFMYKNSLKGDF
ncbi:glycerophosphodiester phosphodiesterase [Virgibacillus byunsanensis]|uniref:Glycerophosphodiester phosphodiesterase n=1 Tax=Virgibacillus byunsanensis TaxID=570945 RepID=A0ABW3LLE3_9BACI